MRKIFMALALSASFTAAHAAELPASIKSRGEISVGVVPNYPPLEMRDPATNNLVGFDIDLGNALAERLGVKIKWQETSFEQLLSGIKTGRLDMVLSGMTDLPARQETATFVDYIRSGTQFFIQASRKGELTSMTSLCGKRVGASRRTSLPDEIKKWSDAECVGKNLPPIQYVGTEGSADARTQLRQGRIDAAMQGNESLPYIFSLDPDVFVMLGEPTRWTLMGIATGKDEKELQLALQKGLQDLKADGTYQKLLDKWSVSNNGVKEFTINGGV